YLLKTGIAMSYTIKIQPSGHSFSVEAEEMILEGALRQGIAFPYGCRSGVCGTCLGNVISGDLHYPDDIPMGMSEHDHEEGRALFCSAIAKSDMVIEMTEIAAAGEIDIKTLPVKVASLHKFAPDVMEVQLKLPVTERLQFLAGQYINILLPDGRKRAFSLANAPYNDEYLELQIRDVPGGKFTDDIFANVKEKDLLRIEGPLGTFFLRDDSGKPKILMGGGTGFAPLKGMIEQLISEGSQDEVYLYWGVRSLVDLYRKDLAEKWAYQYENIHFIPVLSEPQAEDKWQGRVGFVHDAVMADFADLSDYEVYMSGPPIMVNAAVKAFKTIGLKEDSMFSDAFEYADDTLKAIAQA
ncbi:MAG: 2-polyprenylphenol hydroxylase and related flavodoxin oxidoreductases / CDP-6-deoxy-delta-3,4-glucoseen reductase-like, partial [uncultured Thiotrichaceae bacterium]